MTMKQNLPVIDRETELEEGVSLVSKTDLKGVITYANEAFIKVSGFSADELIGRSHNIVRHPDMPPAAFAWMWRTLQRGRPWRGLVKNRCKDGGFYWVDACVVPVRKNNETIGYMSVRQRADRKEIERTEALYAQLRETGAGIPERKLPNLMTIKNGFWLGCIFVIFLMLAGGILGIGGLRLSNDALTSLYQQQLIPIGKVSEIDRLMLENRAVLLEFQHDADQQRQGDEQAMTPASRLADIQARRTEMERLWQEVQAVEMDVAAKSARLAFEHRYQRYLEHGLKPIEAALAAGQFERAAQLVSLHLSPLYHEAAQANQKLQQTMRANAQIAYQETRERNRSIWQAAMAGIAFGIFAVLIVGAIFLRDIVQPLNKAITRFDRIAQGDLTDPVDLSGHGETGQLNRAIATMQLHLKVMMDEISLVSNRIYGSCHHLNTALFEVAEHSEEQHDRVYQATAAMRDTVAESGRLGEQVEQLATTAEQLHFTVRDRELIRAELESLAQQVMALAQQAAVSTRLQAFGAEEIAEKMGQIAELIVDNRHETQSAYAASERLKTAADQLKQLVGYFETTKSANPQ